MNKNKKMQLPHPQIFPPACLAPQLCPHDRHTLMVGTPIRKGSFFKNLSPILPEPKFASHK